MTHSHYLDDEEEGMSMDHRDNVRYHHSGCCHDDEVGLPSQRRVEARADAKIVYDVFLGYFYINIIHESPSNFKSPAYYHCLRAYDIVSIMESFEHCISL